MRTISVYSINYQKSVDIFSKFLKFYPNQNFLALVLTLNQFYSLVKV